MDTNSYAASTSDSVTEPMLIDGNDSDMSASTVRL